MTPPCDVRGRGADAGRLGQHDVETLVTEPRLLLPKLAGLTREHPLGDTLVRARDCVRRHSASGVAKATQTHGTVYWCRERQPLPAPVRIETERVDDRGQPSLRPPLDDLLEQRERVVARGDVVLACTDDGTQRVTRHDLHRREVGAAQVLLPDPDGPTSTTRHGDGSTTSSPVASSPFTIHPA